MTTTRCETSPPPPPPVEPPPHDRRPAAIVIVVLLVAVLVFDLWALRRRKRKGTRTISQTTQDWVQRFGWLVGAAILSLLAVLGWHLVWGLP